MFNESIILKHYQICFRLLFEFLLQFHKCKICVTKCTICFVFLLPFISLVHWVLFFSNIKSSAFGQKPANCTFNL